MTEQRIAAAITASLIGTGAASENPANKSNGKQSKMRSAGVSKTDHFFVKPLPLVAL